MGAVGAPLVASNMLNRAEQSTAFFSVEFYMVFIFRNYLILFIVLLWYRKKYGFYKFRFDDAKIKIKVKDKKIKTWFLYHLVNLVFLNIMLTPITKIIEILENGGIDAKGLLLSVFGRILFTVLVIIPMNIVFGDLEVIKKKK